MHHNSKHVLPVYKKNQYILITCPLHKSPHKMTKKSLKTKLFSISGWNERLSNHRSCIKRMRGKLAKDCIKCLKHRVGPVTSSAADSTVFFLFCYNTNIYKMWKPRKKIQRNYHPGHTPKLLLLDFCFICGTALVQNRYHLNEPCFFLFIYLVKSRVLFFTPENYFCDDWSKRDNVHSVTIFVL